MALYRRSNSTNRLVKAYLLLSLLAAVVAKCAKRLPVGAIPEQAIVATMGDDVINGGRRCATAGPCTAIIDLEKGFTGFAPCVVISTL